MRPKDGPFMARMDKMGKIGEPGRRREKSLAHELKGTPTRASGASPSDKGDIKKGDFLIEAKSSSQASMALKREWLLKIYQEAVNVGKTPLLAINFTNDHGLPMKRGTWVAMPYDAFRELIGE